MTDEEIRAIRDEYVEDCKQAMARRDTKFRQAVKQGRRQADIIRVTGYSRETVRQALNPEIRAVLNARRRKTSQ